MKKQERVNQGKFTISTLTKSRTELLNLLCSIFSVHNLLAFYHFVFIFLSFVWAKFLLGSLNGCCPRSILLFLHPFPHDLSSWIWHEVNFLLAMFQICFMWIFLFCCFLDIFLGFFNFRYIDCTSWISTLY